MNQLVLALAFSGIAALQQGAPLPDELKSKFTGPRARIFCPTADTSKCDDFSLGVEFDTADRQITLEWYWTGPGATRTYHEVENISLSYEPTAFCTKVGAGPVMYVAGYIPRTGHVVVEEWVIHYDLIGVAIPTGGGAVISTLSKTIRKAVVLMTTVVKPLRSIVFHLPQDRLWLFEEQPPNVVWRVDPAVGVPEYYFDASVIPQLPLLLSTRSIMIKDTAPDGGGFIIEFLPWRAWKPKWHTPNNLLPTDQMYVMRDEDLDGVIDESVYTTWGDVQDVRLYYENEEYFYH